MSTEIIIAVLLAAGLAAFFIGVSRARAMSRRQPDVKMHSRLGYYGAYLMLWTVLPAILLTLAWGAFSPSVISRMVQHELPADVQALSGPEKSLVMCQVRSVA